MAVERELFARGYNVYVLDGDNLRLGLNSDLGFSPSDRAENVRRLGEVAALLADAGAIALVSAVSPYVDDRRRAREAAAPAPFLEIHVRASVEACAARDRKGLYRRAAAGEIAEFTGVTAPYEIPLDPELTIDTEAGGIEACVQQAVATILESAGRADQGAEFSI
jgi:bifunctional enzyme CysN/CysC